MFDDFLNELGDFFRWPSVNPTTSLPMMDGGAIDVGGTPYWMEPSDGLMDIPCPCSVSFSDPGDPFGF